VDAARHARAPDAEGELRGQFVAGFRYVAGRPDLVIVFVIVFIIGAFGMNFPIFSSTMAVEFGRGAGEYGLLNSIIAIGSLTGALLAARRERARMRVIILASGFFGVAALLAALMPTFWTFAASTILIGFGAVTILTTANGYVQTTTEPDLRGRVMALYMAILVGGTPVGAPIVGAVAAEWGPRWALGVAAVAAGVAALIGLGWLVFARACTSCRNPRARWRPVVRFADAPTGRDRDHPHRPCGSGTPNRPCQTIRASAGELVPAVPNDRLVAADFSRRSRSRRRSPSRGRTAMQRRRITRTRNPHPCSTHPRSTRRLPMAPVPRAPGHPAPAHPAPGRSPRTGPIPRQTTSS
jgi:hypothetical protein